MNLMRLRAPRVTCYYPRNQSSGCLQTGSGRTILPPQMAQGHDKHVAASSMQLRGLRALLHREHRGCPSCLTR